MILFILILVVIDVYAFRMVRQISVLENKVWVYWLLNVLVYLYFLYLFLDMEFLKQEVSIYFRAFVIIYFFAKLAFIFPLIVEDIWRGLRWIVNRFSKPGTVGVDPESRKVFLKRLSVVLGSIPFMILGYGVIRNIYRYRVLHQKLKIKGLHPDLEGLRIVQISDIHSGTFPERKPVMKGVEMINELNP